jgi:hypothetical protein
MDKELEIAKSNNHEPGYIFGGHDKFTPICFCKKCNLALVYYNGFVISGAYDESCSE